MKVKETKIKAKFQMYMKVPNLNLLYLRILSEPFGLVD